MKNSNSLTNKLQNLSLAGRSNHNDGLYGDFGEGPSWHDTNNNLRMTFEPESNIDSGILDLVRRVVKAVRDTSK